MKTYVNVIKKDATIDVPFTTEDIVKLQSILLRHLDHQLSLDDKSWNIIEEICERIDEHARKQNKTETRELQF